MNIYVYKKNIAATKMINKNRFEKYLGRVLKRHTPQASQILLHILNKK